MKQHKRDFQNSRVVQYTPLVHRVAHHLSARLPNHVQVEDLIQAGMMGLLEAFKNFDLAKECSFETFASIRIRGAMLDEVRKGSWLPRSYHRTIRKIRKAINTIEHRTQQHAKDSDIAVQLGISLEDYRQMLTQISTGQMMGFEEVGLDEDKMQGHLTEDKPDPFQDCVNSVFKQHLTKHIESLPEKESLVLALYYDKELNLKEISKVLGVTESRVCQIHNQAMVRLQARMREWR